ncbi:hypothetical protein M758_5G034600 [Ceratodon purpureus]|nr:hypothetical protein M758_5G034600 [Ceratodon purpureus]
MTRISLQVLIFLFSSLSLLTKMTASYSRLWKPYWPVNSSDTAISCFINVL